jgi:hypothetical protein
MQSSELNAPDDWIALNRIVMALLVGERRDCVHAKRSSALLGADKRNHDARSTALAVC